MQSGDRTTFYFPVVRDRLLIFRRVKYARIVRGWVREIGLNLAAYGTHTNSSMHDKNIFSGVTYQIWRLSELKVLRTAYFDVGRITMRTSAPRSRASGRTDLSSCRLSAAASSASCTSTQRSRIQNWCSGSPVTGPNRGRLKYCATANRSGNARCCTPLWKKTDVDCATAPNIAPPTEAGSERPV